MGRQDYETETLIPTRGGFFDDGPTHSLRADGFDASEDGTGRGTPLVPIPICESGKRANLKDSPKNGMGIGREGDPMFTIDTDQGTQCVAFSCKDSGLDAGTLSPTLRGVGHDGSHANAGGQVAVAFDLRGREGGEMPEGEHDTANLRAASGGSSRSYVAASSVRRLTPVECERLQGFPDDYTAITFRGKPAADGTRYKALGNSMAVPCMAWLGRRIAMVDAL